MKDPRPPAARVLGAWLPWLFAAGLGLLGIWQFHNVEFYSHFDLVPGGRGDNRFIVAILEYLYRASKGVGSFLSPAFYYPAHGTLGYSDVFLTHALLYGWLRNLGLDIFTSFQVCVLVFDVFNYAACFLLLHRGLRFNATPSALGAFLFAFNAPKFNQMGHPQLQCLFWLPLILWALVEWAKGAAAKGRLRGFALLSAAALMLDVQLLTDFYCAWFLMFWLCLFLGLSLSFRETRGFLKERLAQGGAAPVLGAGAVFAAGLAPFLWIYLPVLRDLGGKHYSEVRMMIPDFWSFFWMGPRHGLWGWIWYHCADIRHYPVEGEERLGFGLTVTAAGVLLAGWVLRLVGRAGRRGTLCTLGAEFRGARKTYARFAGLAFLATSLFILLGLRYPGGFSPWHLVYAVVPGAGSIRAVARYALILALPFSIVLAFALHLFWEKVKAEKRRAARFLLAGALALAAGMAVFEQVDLPPYPAFSKSWDLNRLEYLSEKLPRQCKAFYVAVEPGAPLYPSVDIQIDAMLISAVRGIPTINGYSGQSPDNWGLFKIRSPKYHEYVADWLRLNKIRFPVCGIGIDR